MNLSRSSSTASLLLPCTVSACTCMPWQTVLPTLLCPTMQMCEASGCMSEQSFALLGRGRGEGGWFYGPYCGGGGVRSREVAHGMLQCCDSTVGQREGLPPPLLRARLEEHPPHCLHPLLHHRGRSYISAMLHRHYHAACCGQTSLHPPALQRPVYHQLLWGCKQRWACIHAQCNLLNRLQTPASTQYTSTWWRE